MENKLKTHVVLDLHYLPEEGQECFVGTREECEEEASRQSPHFMYVVRHMTEAEIKNYPDNEAYFAELEEIKKKKNGGE